MAPCTTWRTIRLLGAALLLLAGMAMAQDAPQKTFRTEQIDQFVAPVALYPDALLSQIFMASTYPSDVAEAAAWSKANPKATGDAAVKQVSGKPWDPSVQSLVAFPGARPDGRAPGLGAEHRRCLPRTARRRDGVGTTPARAGTEGGKPENHRAAEGCREGDGTADDGDPDRARQSGSRLCAQLQPDRGVRHLGVSLLSADLLATAARLLPSRCDGPCRRPGVRHGHRHRGLALGRFRLGAQRRRHQRQSLQQHQRQQSHLG